MKSMSNKRLIIIGGVAGGASAAAPARRLCEDCEIIVSERGPHVSFANCGLLYFVGGEIAEQDSLLLEPPESLKPRFNLDVRVKTEVIRIDRAARRIRVRELESGREYEAAYDALILSTGVSPLRLPLPGIERPNHFVVRNIPDVEKIMAWSKDCELCRDVVVGGGYIGLEMAEQLRHRGFDVTVAQGPPQVMTPFDPGTSPLRFSTSSTLQTDSMSCTSITLVFMLFTQSSSCSNPRCDSSSRKPRDGVAEQARLDVHQLERLLQKRIVVEIYLADRKVVRRAPIGVNPV